MVWWGLWYGLVTGTALGMFLKTIQWATGERVYTLLLNIDFLIPKPLPEVVEFGLHLIVSMVFGVLYMILCIRLFRISRMTWGIVMGILTMPLFFPLTVLSTRTPAVDDGSALAWWCAGHLLYGILLGLCGVMHARRHALE
jgi:hypothetical protein